MSRSKAPKSPPQKPDVDPAPAAPPLPWSRGARVVVSVLVLLHLAAVIAAPMAGPGPASELSKRAAGFFQPYLLGADLGHGYRFFAPDPGASALVRYTIELPDGSVKEGQFPSVDDNWPRLLYHRYFMITETVNNLHRDLVLMQQPSEFPLTAQGELERRVQTARVQGQLTELLAALAIDLLEQAGGEKVELTLVNHGIADPALVQQGVRIDDERWYETRTLGSLSKGGEWAWSDKAFEPRPEYAPGLGPEFFPMPSPMRGLVPGGGPVPGPGPITSPEEVPARES